MLIVYCHHYSPSLKTAFLNGLKMQAPRPQNILQMLHLSKMFTLNVIKMFAVGKIATFLISDSDFSVTKDYHPYLWVEHTALCPNE